MFLFCACGIIVEMSDTKKTEARVAAEKILRTAKPRRKTKRAPPRTARFIIDAASIKQKLAYARSIAFYGNNTAAFRAAFEDIALTASPVSICHYARELNADPVVREEVVRLLNERDDALESYAGDTPRAGIGGLAKMANVLRADHEAIVVSLIGQPVSAIYDLTEQQKGVVKRWGMRFDGDGNAVISNIELRDPVHAAEVLARWKEGEKARIQGDSAAVEVYGVEVDESPKLRQNGAEIGVEDID